MVQRLRREGRVRTPVVEEAFREVPRHLFLPESSLDEAYQDEAVATKWRDGIAISSASQPSMMAIMLEQLALEPGHRVLEIGAGTGYNAALMAHIVGPTGSVVAVDIDEDLVGTARARLGAAGCERVTLVTGDGALGYPDKAPYDRIILTVGSWDIQPEWWRQLAPGGRLLLPLAVCGSQLSIAFDLAELPERQLHSDSVRSCAFIRMRGQGAGPEGDGAGGADGFVVRTADDRELDTTEVLAMLAAPGVDRPATGIRLGAADLWDGLGLWLAVRDPDACRLLIDGTAEADRHVPSLLPAGEPGGTVVLLGERGLAAITPVTAGGPVRESAWFPVSVRPYGADAEGLADRLVAHLRDYAAAGQPSAGGLRIRAYPASGGELGVPRAGDVVVRKEHSRLELAWPVRPAAAPPPF